MATDRVVTSVQLCLKRTHGKCLHNVQCTSPRAAVRNHGSRQDWLPDNNTTQDVNSLSNCACNECCQIPFRHCQRTTVPAGLWSKQCHIDNLIYHKVTPELWARAGQHAPTCAACARLVRESAAAAWLPALRQLCACRRPQQPLPSP